MTTPSTAATTAPTAAAAMEAQPIEVFRAGTRAADDGTVYTITAQDMQRAAAAYNPALHEAPLVIGHPEHDHPAWGGVAGIAVSDAGAVTVRVRQVDPAFAEGVRAGRWKQRSAAFYHPDDPVNPTPGTWYLRHVGFLGAKPPAVKGLAGIKFASPPTRSVEFSEATWTLARLARGMREWLLEKFGAEEADRVVPGWAVADAEQAARAEDAEHAASAPLAPQFAEAPPAQKAATPATPEGAIQVTPEEIAAAKAAKEAAEAENAALRAQLAAVEKAGADQRHAAHVAFAEGAVKAPGGPRLKPADAPALVAVLDTLAATHAAKPVQFSEGAGDAAKSVTVDPVAFVQRLVMAQPALVQFGEFTPEGGAVGTFGAPGVGDPSDPAELDRMAQAYAAKHRVAYAEALRAVAPQPTFTA